MNDSGGLQQQAGGKEDFRLPIGGFLKQSFSDFPGRVAAVLFTRGCNFRCIYCHNPELVLPDLLRHSKPYEVKGILEWLSSNRSLLDAVVITGGEPTMHPSLPDFIRQIKSLGLEVKLDTNGTNPQMLEMLMSDKIVDYIAMDIKNVLDHRKYASVCGVGFSETMLADVTRSLTLLHDAVIDCEIRTTLLGSHHSENDIAELVRLVRIPYFLQECNSSKTLQAIAPKRWGRKEIAELMESLEPKVGNVCLR
jgi:pyruvate formate lyase activating enzyme